MREKPNEVEKSTKRVKKGEPYPRPEREGSRGRKDVKGDPCTRNISAVCPN